MSMHTIEETSPDYKLISRILQCGICRKTVRDPKQLSSCLHSFCHTCIDQHKSHKGVEVKCPSCDKPVKNNDIDSSVFLFNLLHIQEKMKEEMAKSSDEDEQSSTITFPLCQQCKEEESEAQWKCLDCKNNICKKCKLMHKNIPTLSKHDIEKITESESVNFRIIDRVLNCSEHSKKQLDMNCSTCKKLICSMCALDKHASHKKEKTEAALTRIQDDIQASSKNIQTVLRSQQLEVIDKKIAETRENFTVIRTGLEEKFDFVISRLKSLKESLDNQVDKHEIVSITELNKWKACVQNEREREMNLMDLKQASDLFTRNLSQLQTVQGKIHERMVEQDSKGLKNMNFHIPYLKLKAADDISVRINNAFAEILSVGSHALQINMKGVLQEDNCVVKPHQHTCQETKHRVNEKLC